MRTVKYWTVIFPIAILAAETAIAFHPNKTRFRSEAPILTVHDLKQRSEQLDGSPVRLRGYVAWFQDNCTLMILSDKPAMKLGDEFIEVSPRPLNVAAGDYIEIDGVYSTAKAAPATIHVTSAQKALPLFVAR